MKPLKKLTIIAFLLLAIMAPVKVIFAQQINVESLITRKSFNCQDVASSATQVIPALHQANQTDTLYALISFWEENCGLPEPLMRFHILHQIEINNFSEEWLPQNLMIILNDYRQISSWDNPNYYLDPDYLEYYAIDPAYNFFSRYLAEQLQQFTDLSPVELFYLEYYSNNFEKAFSRLSNGELAGSFIDSLYQLSLVAEKKARKHFIGFYGGLWRPRGELALLGNHPEFGFSFGFVQQRFLLEGILKIGFLPSPNTYEVLVNGLGYQTNNFTNLHFSARIGVDLLNYNKHQLLFSFGLGYEGIQAFTTAEQEDYGLSRLISSVSINPGIEYRFPAGETSYLGLSFRYNLLNFNNRGGTPLPGNALLFGISYGFETF